MAEVEGFDLEGFGARVRERREEVRLSQPALAEMVGVHETAVRRWERGEDLPSGTVYLVKLASALDRSISWLLGEEPDAQRIEAARLAFEYARDQIAQLVESLQLDPDTLFGEMAGTAPSAPAAAVTTFAQTFEEQKSREKPVQRVAEAPPVPRSPTPGRTARKKPKPEADQAG